MSSTVAAGWYADPSGSASHRWWDGQAWTEHTSDGPTAGPTADVGQSGPQYGQPNAGHYGAPQYGQPDAGQPYGNQPNGQYQFSPPTRPAAPGNRFAYITFAIVAVYLVVAFTVGVVFFGILPVLMAFRSRSAREPLAPLAIAAAVVSVILAIAVLAGH